MYKFRVISQTVSLLDSALVSKALKIQPAISGVHSGLLSTSTRNASISSGSRFLEGRVAVITGSTSGIGEAVARSLASKGCHVVLNGFGDPQHIKQLQNQIESEHKVKAAYFGVDLTKEDHIVKFVEDLKSIHPAGIDILINNAGFQHVSSVEEFSPERWNALIAVLLSAPFHLIRLLLPGMKKRQWGRIINIASVHSIRASPYKAAYVSGKHGVAGLTKVVALESAGTGVTCNAISPGYVDTPLFQKQVKALGEKEGLPYDTAKKQFLSSFHPSKDAVGVESIGEMCLFLCSEAANQVTGSNLIMDGGWSSK